MAKLLAIHHFSSLTYTHQFRFNDVFCMFNELIITHLHFLKDYLQKPVLQIDANQALLASELRSHHCEKNLS